MHYFESERKGGEREGKVYFVYFLLHKDKKLIILL